MWSGDDLGNPPDLDAKQEPIATSESVAKTEPAAHKLEPAAELIPGVGVGLAGQPKLEEPTEPRKPHGAPRVDLYNDNINIEGDSPDPSLTGLTGFEKLFAFGVLVGLCMIFAKTQQGRRQTLRQMREKSLA